MDLLYSILFFRERGRDCFETYRATAEFFNDYVQYIAISLIQTPLINFYKRYIVYFYAKYVCRTFQYLCDLTLDVIVKTECTTGESRTKGRAKHRNACCRGDECEGW